MWASLLRPGVTGFPIRRLLQAGVLLLCFVLRATPQVAVDHWTTDNGLPLNSVGSICQTPEGYLWLATPDGLVRFDGTRFSTFNKSNSEGIEGNRFGWMFCGPNGDLWAATEGSGITLYREGRFKTYTIRDGIASDNLSGISADSDGSFWVLSGSRVCQWYPARRRFFALAEKQYQYSDVLSPYIRGVFCRIDETGLHLFAHGNQLNYGLPTGWSLNEGLMAGDDLNKNIWLATKTGKLAQLVDGHWSSVRSPKSRVSHNGKASLTSYYYRDSHGTLWQVEGGWDAGGRFQQSLILPPGNVPGMIDFSALFDDREGNIWLSTDGHGLWRLRRPIIKVYSQEDGLPDRNVYPIYESKDGSIWIGTWSGGLCRLKDRIFTTFSTENGLASDRTYAIAEGQDAALWVAVEGGLYRMRNTRFQPVSLNGIISNHTVIRAIHRDPNGVMWFGTGEGLLRLQHDTWALLTKKNGLATEDVRVIIDGRDGSVWAGGYGGLSRLRDGRVQAWTEADGLVSNAIRALYEDASGVLWIGTYDGGLCRFENGKFTKYSVREGLFNNGVFQILEDARGNLWMSCNRGIYRVSKQQLNDFAAGKTNAINSIDYGRQDGMRNIECNGGLSPAGIKRSDGTLWFPTQDGVAVINTEKLPARPPPPPVFIESVLIDGTAAAINHLVRVTPGHENLEIRYTALSFINSERIRFQYQLLGLDRDWVRAGARRTAYYSHVPPGSYTFRVTAAHRDGVWNSLAVALPLVILPPFYQAWWFELLLFLAVATSLWLAWRSRMRQWQRARAAQQAFSRQLIDSQENERKRIAAELHDGLGQRLVIIKNLALFFLRSQDEAAIKNGKLHLIEEISEEASLAADESREIAYNLRPFQLDRLGLTKAIEGIIRTASDASKTHFSSELDNIDHVFPEALRINFYRIVQECLNNIIKHAQATEASVNIKRTASSVMLTVHDNGAGFEPPNGRPEINCDSSPRGFGLTGMEERARALGGELIIRTLPGRGTVVSLTIHSEGDGYA